MTKHRRLPAARIWVSIDPTNGPMMRSASLYVLYAVLDKTGGFAKKAGVTKKSMGNGIVRSFIVKPADERRVLRALNAYDGMIASSSYHEVRQYSRACLAPA